MLPYALSLVVGFLVSAGILPAVIRFANKFGVVDQPGGRRAHQHAVPRLGGIGIFLGFVAGTGCATLAAGRASSLGDPTEFSWKWLAVGMSLIFASGILDDLFQLKPSTKLLLQLAATTIAVMSGFTIRSVTSPFGGVINLGVLSPFITGAWILLIMNAVNLIDGLDGLAGGLALIVTATVASIAVRLEQFGVVISAVALAGALIGFLRHNFAPARIFMGDGGSQFLGYVLAVISIRGSQKGPTAVAILVPVLILGLPILDVATTIARRTRRALPTTRNPIAILRSVSRADREHLHHNLLDLGISPRAAVLAMYLVASLFALSGYLALALNSLPVAGIVLAVSIGSVFLIKSIGRFYAGGASHAKDRPSDVLLGQGTPDRSETAAGTPVQPGR
ncbi:MAG TPA: MraY family glycosyltransferase [Candidatus Polarisedimenticolaceae bacterium]|nr:MraY family glycosyltransferase [Candidatus Polarisedimenticolaceae bacterium]